MKKILVASVLSIGMALSVQAKDIVDTAVSAGSFKTLATALGAAGLVDTLKGKGVKFMEEGQNAWHGSAPNQEQLDKACAEIMGGGK